MTRHYFPVIFIILTACYSAEQDNPFDPERTPAVTLVSVQANEVSQTITVTWTSYAGIEPFQSYKIQRKEPGADPIIVGTTGTVGDTVFVDSSVLPGITYTYSILIENASGLEVASVDQITENLPAPSRCRTRYLIPLQPQRSSGGRRLQERTSCPTRSSVKLRQAHSFWRLFLIRIRSHLPTSVWNPRSNIPTRLR